MKFSTPLSQFLTSIQIVSRAIGTDQVLPILQNIHIAVQGGIDGVCTLSATNLELSTITTLSVSVEEEGKVTIPMKPLLHFLQYNSDETLTIRVTEGTHIHLESKTAKALIIGEGVGGYPTISTLENATECLFPLPPLLQALHLTTFSAAKTSTRPVLSGVSLRTNNQTLTLATTDSYRLSEIHIESVVPLPGDINIIIPAKFFDEVKTIVTHLQSSIDSTTHLTLRFTQQQVEVRLLSTIISSRLIEGKFPDYTAILPKERKTSVTFQLKELLSTIKRLHYFAKEQSNSIVFSFTDSHTILTTRSTQVGKDEATLLIHKEGEDNKIALSSLYLIDFLSRISDTEITLHIHDKLHPAIFTIPSQPQFLHLVMPLRLIET